MADYYMSYSAEIEGLTEEESKWAHSRIKEIEDAGEEDAVCELGEVEVADGALWFHGEGHGDPRAVAEFARDFLKRFRPRDSFALEYAYTCSRPRLDGFGGGAVFVTAEGIECVETAAWVAERRREHEIRRGGADECWTRARKRRPGQTGGVTDLLFSGDADDWADVCESIDGGRTGLALLASPLGRET